MADSTFHMINVGEKIPTQRRAIAQGRIELSPAAFQALVEKKNPKGDVLAIAEISGILAAKSVPQILPLCHPLPIEQILISYELEPARHSVVAFCEVNVTAKTGAEMEALAGVNGALLCIYDLSKAVDPVLKISDIRLNSKHGGKSGAWFHPEFEQKSETAAAAAAAEAAAAAAAAKKPALDGIRVALITVSDRTFSGETEDKSGPALWRGLESLGAIVVGSHIVPDEIIEIQNQFRHFALESQAQVVISTGGTGLSPRDVTPEALTEICDRLVPGFGEALRADGAKHIYSAYLSRSMAGSIGSKLLIALPGSPNAVVEGLNVLAPLLKHALHTLAGGDHAKTVNHAGSNAVR